MLKGLKFILNQAYVYCIGNSYKVTEVLKLYITLCIQKVNKYNLVNECGKENCWINLRIL